MPQNSHLESPNGNIGQASASDNGSTVPDFEATPARGKAGPRRPTIYLDMTDIIEYLKHNTTVSGIQRVVANLITHAPAAADERGWDVVLVFPDYRERTIFAVGREYVMALLEALDASSKADRQALDRAIREIYEVRTRVEPAAGDIFTIAGAFWTYEDYDLLIKLRRTGVAVVNFIHDLIQISNPEFVFEAATRQFRRALVDILASSTGFLTNSEYVARDLVDYIAKRTNVSVPVLPVPLATELIASKSADVKMSAQVRERLKTPYVLSVSTIEVRKNHAFMVRVWKRLIEMGVENLPDLVFVGKIGWDIDPFIAYLEKIDYLGGKVHILHHISDDELSELYRNARFTMYMSFAEGFGLPVAESLAYGTPCISSNRSSMPEVGGRFARYLDPEDIEAGAEMVRALLADPADLAAWKQDILDNFHPRTWREFSQDYVAKLLALPAADWKTCNNTFAPNEIHGMGRWEVAHRDANDQTLVYLANTRLNGWAENEDWGCWMAFTRATMALTTSLAAGTPITLFVLLKSPREQSARVELSAGGQCADLGIVKQDPAWKRMDCAVGDNGVLSIAFKVSTPRPQTRDGENRYLGVLGLAFCEAEDREARLALAETMALEPGRLGPPPVMARPALEMYFGPEEDAVNGPWYLERYPDVALIGMPPQEHYDWLGKRLGRHPNPKVEALRSR